MVVKIHVKEEWRFACTVHGTRCVMTVTGIATVQELYVSSWVSAVKVSLTKIF